MSLTIENNRSRILSPDIALEIGKSILGDASDIKNLQTYLDEEFRVVKGARGRTNDRRLYNRAHAVAELTENINDLGGVPPYKRLALLSARTYALQIDYDLLPWEQRRSNVSQRKIKDLISARHASALVVEEMLDLSGEESTEQYVKFEQAIAYGKYLTHGGENLHRIGAQSPGNFLSGLGREIAVKRALDEAGYIVDYAEDDDLAGIDLVAKDQEGKICPVQIKSSAGLQHPIECTENNHRLVVKVGISSNGCRFSLDDHQKQYLFAAAANAKY